VKLTEVLSASMGLSTPWKITDVKVASESRRLDITIKPCPDKSHCPHYVDLCPMPEKESTVWVNKNFLNYHTYLHVYLQPTACRQCSVCPPPPWIRKGSHFTRMDADPDGR